MKTEGFTLPNVLDDSFLRFFSLTEVWSTCNIMLVSDEQHSDSVIYIYIYIHTGGGEASLEHLIMEKDN